MKGYVYILKSLKNGRYYVGSTSNLNRRMNEHNTGVSNYTKNVLPVTLLFYQEFAELKTARIVESRIKKFKSRKIIERILKDQEIKMGLWRNG